MVGLQPVPPRRQTRLEHLAEAAQSAIFYYANCSPCIEARDERTRLKRAQRERKEREKKPVTEGYVHPPPMSTNPFWREEICRGPSLPRKGKRKISAVKNSSQRDLTNQTGSSVSMATNSSKQSAGPSPAVAESQDASGADFLTCPRQREDEELWGVHIRPFERYPSLTSTQADTLAASDDRSEQAQSPRLAHRLVGAVFKAGESAGRLVSPLIGRDGPSVASNHDRYNFYRSSSIKTPPVNDYHPPVVSSRPAHVDGNKWMLQPPPPAAVMSGHVPVSRASSVARRTNHEGGIRVMSVEEKTPLGTSLHDARWERKEFSTISGECPASTRPRCSTPGYKLGSLDDLSVVKETPLEPHGTSGSRRTSTNEEDEENIFLKRQRPRRSLVKHLPFSYVLEEKEDYISKDRTTGATAHMRSSQ